MGRHLVKLTSTQKRTIIELYQTTPLIDVAVYAGLGSVHLVNRFLRENGLTKHHKKLSEADKQFVREHYAFMSVSKMRQELGLKTNHLILNLKALEKLYRKPGNNPDKKMKTAGIVRQGYFNVNDMENWAI